MGFFDTVESVDPSGASPRFPPNGDFIFRVNECRVHQGQWGTRFILEADVISSSLPDVGSGTRRSWTCQIDGAYGKIGIGEVKAFAAAAYGIDPTNTVEANAKITKAVMDAVIGPGQPLAGRVIRTTTVEKTTKSVNDMTKHVWYVVDAATVASLGLSVPSGPPAAPPHVPPPPGALGALGAPPPPAAGPFPPIGWTAHPSAPGYFYKGADVKSEADLRAAAARGIV